MKEFFRERYQALKSSEHHWVRKIVGTVLVLFGLIGFMPVVGFWMIPLGLALLAVDFPIIRRFNRRVVKWWQKLRRRVSRRRKGGRS